MMPGLPAIYCLRPGVNGIDGSKSGKQLQQQINKLIKLNETSASVLDSRLVTLDINVTNTLELV
jgi:hypothetical protein